MNDPPLAAQAVSVGPPTAWEPGSPPGEKPPFPEVIDSTMRLSFSQCPSAFRRSFLEFIAPQGGAVHLDFGAAFASGLETARLSFFEKGDPPDLAIGKGLASIWRNWNPSNPEHPKKHLSSCESALVSYFQEYPLESDLFQPLILPEGRRAIEWNFAIPIDIIHPVTGNPIIYCGRFDMIAQYGRTIFVLDEKTCSQLGDTWPNQWDLRAQYLGYVWATRKSGIKTEGVLTRGICIGGGDGEDIRHASCPTVFPSFLLDEWYEQLLDEVSEMIARWEKWKWKKAWNDSCNAFGGCAFKMLCRSSSPETLLPVYYTTRKWDPLEKRTALSL